MTIETRIFVGETATAVGAGFRIGRTYKLQVEHRADDTVAIVLDHHEHVSAGTLVATQPGATPALTLAEVAALLG